MALPHPPSMHEVSEEQVVSVPAPDGHFTVLRAPSGEFLSARPAAEAHGQVSFFLSRWVADDALWSEEAASPSSSRFVHFSKEGRREVVLEGTALPAQGGEGSGGASGSAGVAGDHGRPLRLHLSSGGSPRALDERGLPAAAGAAAVFLAQRGPAHPPSEYLDHMRKHGWVCLPALLPPEMVGALRHVAQQGGAEPFLESPVLAKAGLEPTVMWVLRQYLRTKSIQWGHVPNVLTAYPIGDRRYPGPQGWHSDFPYLWRAREGRIPEGEQLGDSDGLPLGVQFNTCIDAFTKDNGSTRFVLGSHRRNRGPPRAWNGSPDLPGGMSTAGGGVVGRHVQPYCGAGAQTIDCPAGSVILYDARTWHRQGENRTNSPRAAVPLAIVPNYVMPFFDKSRAFKRFVKSPRMDELSERERRDLRDMMLTRVGAEAVGPDRELNPPASKL
mmetsp:Transcript_40503/g.126059  ORF Transcript_40503/g.126059 Transcript_40503/m.126059 type:complete len:442 (-) Transcript_40503:61-1386(-)